MEYFTQSNIMFTIGLIGIGFTIFKSFYDPQKQSETNDLLVSQKIKLMCDEYDKRFISMQDDFSALLAQNQNHLHTIDTKVDALTVSIIQLGKDTVRLETIVNERIPQRST